MSNRNIDEDDVLSGFNPFASTEPVKPFIGTSSPRPIFNPAILPEHPKPTTNQHNKALQDLESNERALKDLETELKRREEKLNSKENIIKGVKVNNFPPLPQCFPCKPCFYQDMDVDISPEYRGMVKLGFYIWIAYSILLFFNIFGTLCYFIVNSTDNDSGPMFGVAIVIFILMTPFCYILWFRPLYRAFRSQSSVNFFMFFLFFAIFIILNIIQALGINVLGSCGWFNSLTIISKQTGIGVFMFIIALGFTVIVLTSAFLFIKVHRIYRGTGASFDKAKNELRNETVYSAFHS